MNEQISIDESDVDMLKHSSSRVPVGALLTRGTVLQLALMSSDNRAAAALARTYPGGKQAFVFAVREKLRMLDMHDTVIEEPTGLSPHNRSSAADLLKMASAASHYSEISRLTTNTEEQVDVNGRMVSYHNTNRLVGRDGWNILLSKTGFTQEAGRCLIMRMQAAGKHVIVVLLNAKESAARIMDAENVQRYLNGQPLFAARTRSHTLARRARGGKGGIVLVKSRAGSKVGTKSHRKRKTV